MTRLPADICCVTTQAKRVKPYRGREFHELFFLRPILTAVQNPALVLLFRTDSKPELLNEEKL